MYELDKEAFGRFVAQARKARGLTQRQLAGQLHVTDKAVSKWERGPRGCFSAAGWGAFRRSCPS